MSKQGNANKCAVCGRTFVLKSSLKIHLVNHRDKDLDSHTSSEKNIPELTEKTDKINRSSSSREDETGKSWNDFDIKNMCEKSGESLNEVVKPDEDEEIELVDDTDNKNTINVTKNEASTDSVKVENDLIYSANDQNSLTSDNTIVTNRNESVALDAITEYSANEKDTSYDELQTELEFPGDPSFQHCHFECGICGKQYSCMSGLTKHMHTHTTKKSRACILCPKKFSKRNGLEAHMARHSLKDSQRCKICKKQFGYVDAFKRHKAAILEKRFQCKICMVVFCSGGLLLKHKPLCKLEKSYERKARQVCSVCKTAFASEELLRKHKQLESHVCSICQVRYKTCPELKFHMTMHNFYCLKCFITFKNKDELRKHNKIHDEEAVTCPICKRRFRSKHSVPTHIKRVHGGMKDIQCETCGKMLTKPAYRNHLRVHTGERPFKCKECGARFVQHAHLKAHMKSHRGIKDFQCDICGRAFAARQTLNIHHRTHTKEKPYVCQYCSKRFSHPSSLKAHVVKHSALDNYNCPICSKVFYDSRLLCNHYQQHSDEDLSILDAETLLAIKEHKFHSCLICEQTFTSKRMLHIHYSGYSDDKLQKLDVKTLSFVRKLKGKGTVCHLCDKEFTHSGALREHMRLHTGEKPYVCDFCDKSFRIKQMLENHRRIHTGERPFKCKLCEKSFMQRSHVTGHMLTHTGEKPHACRVCGKFFAHNGNRRVHEKTHQKNWDSNNVNRPIYKCSFCDAEYTSKTKYEVHVNSCTHLKEEMIELEYISGESIPSESYISGEEETVLEFSEGKVIKIGSSSSEEATSPPSVSVLTPNSAGRESPIIIRIGNPCPIKEENVLHIIEENDTHY